MSELPKTFDPKAIEERWYAHWEERGLFRPERPDATPWTIVSAHGTAHRRVLGMWPGACLGMTFAGSMTS